MNGTSLGKLFETLNIYDKGTKKLKPLNIKTDDVIKGLKFLKVLSEIINEGDLKEFIDELFSYKYKDDPFYGKYMFEKIASHRSHFTSSIISTGFLLRNNSMPIESKRKIIDYTKKYIIKKKINGAEYNEKNVLIVVWMCRHMIASFSLVEMMQIFNDKKR